MELKDFTIGLEFETSTGQRWRCTDVGTRTILAIDLDPKLTADWMKGPPYVVPEVVFNQRAIELAYLSVEAAIKEDVSRYHKERVHPGFPSTVMRRLMSGRITSRTAGYPYMGMLKVDRVFMDERILHPYAAEKRSDQWVIMVYDLFSKTFGELVESEFVKLPYATYADLQKQADMTDG